MPSLSYGMMALGGFDHSLLECDPLHPSMMHVSVSPSTITPLQGALLRFGRGPESSVSQDIEVRFADGDEHLRLLLERRAVEGAVLLDVDLRAVHERCAALNALAVLFGRVSEVLYADVLEAPVGPRLTLDGERVARDVGCRALQRHEVAAVPLESLQPDADARRRDKALAEEDLAPQHVEVAHVLVVRVDETRLEVQVTR